MNMKLLGAARERGRSARRQPKLIGQNGMVDFGVYLVEFQLDDEDPKAGVWRMRAMQVAGYWFSASDNDLPHGARPVREAGYRVIRQLKSSRLTLADFQREAPGIVGRVVGGIGGPYCAQQSKPGRTVTGRRESA